MSYEDFEGFWKVTISAEDKCPKDSIVTFDRTGTHDDPERVTILCVEKPSFFYGEGTGRYKPEPENTIEVKIGEETYAISMKVNDSGTPEIAFGPKGSGPGPAAGSWTAEDYVPGPPPEPAGE